MATQIVEKANGRLGGYKPVLSFDVCLQLRITLEQRSTRGCKQKLRAFSAQLFHLLDRSRAISRIVNLSIFERDFDHAGRAIACAPTDYGSGLA